MNFMVKLASFKKKAFADTVAIQFDFEVIGLNDMYMVENPLALWNNEKILYIWIYPDDWIVLGWSE